MGIYSYYLHIKNKEGGWRDIDMQGMESIEEPRTYTPYIYLSICLSTSVAAASAAAAELNKNKGMSRGLLLIYL